MGLPHSLPGQSPAPTPPPPQPPTLTLPTPPPPPPQVEAARLQHSPPPRTAHCTPANSSQNRWSSAPPPPHSPRHPPHSSAP
ncbi:MAG: hypothetical protein C4311_15635 [Chloroflexota bacterium]